jgi:predicted O-methyltransferase YrrM
LLVGGWSICIGDNAVIERCSHPGEIRRRTLEEAILAQDFETFFDELESDPALLEPSGLRTRLEALDRLDALLGSSEGEPRGGTWPSHAVLARARLARIRLEQANETLYASVRAQIQGGLHPDLFLSWIDASAAIPVAGLSYEFRDEAVAGILELEEPAVPALPRSSETVFYQPTPARHIFRLIRLSALSSADVFIDLGSGLGHVAMLIGICTGARCVGIEQEEEYVACAQRCASKLNLRRVTFLNQDACAADLSAGTIFYLYTPFLGTLLDTAIERLRQEARKRAIHVLSLGPCTAVLARAPWLEARGEPDPGQIATFHS